MARKGRKGFHKAFGLGDDGLPDIPAKISNVKISRIVWTISRGGCSLCFPHGTDTTNCTARQNRRSWKNYRRTRYRVKPV